MTPISTKKSSKTPILMQGPSLHSGWQSSCRLSVVGRRYHGNLACQLLLVRLLLMLPC